MIITVIVPTYRRQKDLERCLESLKQQTRPADEILVVVRDTDVATRTFLETFNINSLSLRTVKVCIPGQVAALNRGLDESKGDIIAITDDDAAPRPEWLQRIENHFISDENVGGVGGRDWIHRGNQLIDGERHVVGKVQWYGRKIGNHNLGVGEPREVEILKGANMSYRRTAIANLRFDERLLGSGSQINNDMAFSFKLKKKGWKLIYDPLVEVNHYPGQRFNDDPRNQFNETGWSNRIHNETLAILEYLPPLRRSVYIMWSILIGTRGAFGFLQLLRFLPSQGKLAIRKWLASILGRWQGFSSWQESNRQSKLFRNSSKSIDKQLC